MLVSEGDLGGWDGASDGASIGRSNNQNARLLYSSMPDWLYKLARDRLHDPLHDRFLDRLRD